MQNKHSTTSTLYSQSHPRTPALPLLISPCRSTSYASLSCHPSRKHLISLARTPAPRTRSLSCGVDHNQRSHTHTYMHKGSLLLVLHLLLRRPRAEIHVWVQRLRTPRLMQMHTGAPYLHRRRRRRRRKKGIRRERKVCDMRRTLRGRFLGSGFESAHPFFRARIVIDFDEEEKEEKAEGIVKPRL